ncbi:hypothetical protein E2C01_043201 [Portunus trituberculatus]|uniref:Uncharacterized protein n=1 Tax=Portunus trituberculatus TaxID=210409 RepID=A0A5B7FSB1_PORTR|nr:hypothetical protein [Portunus trituberculatus]
MVVMVVVMVMTSPSDSTTDKIALLLPTFVSVLPALTGGLHASLQPTHRHSLNRILKGSRVFIC